MSRTRLTILSAIALAAGAAALYPFLADDSTATAGAAIERATSGAPRPATAAQAPAPSTDSPFGRGPAAVETDPASLREQRHRKMLAQGYATPPEYAQMSVKTLAGLAEKGDIYALLQLGEQYYSESDALQNDPDYRTDASPQQIGKQYFEHAALTGHNHAAVILSQKYMEEGKPVETYAWAQLAEKLGDRQAADLGQQALRALTPQQREMAEVKLNEMHYRVIQRFAQK